MPSGFLWLCDVVAAVSFGFALGCWQAALSGSCCFGWSVGSLAWARSWLCILPLFLVLQFLGFVRRVGVVVWFADVGAAASFWFALGCWGGS